MGALPSRARQESVFMAWDTINNNYRALTEIFTRRMARFMKSLKHHMVIKPCHPFLVEMFGKRRIPQLRSALIL